MTSNRENNDLIDQIKNIYDFFTSDKIFSKMIPEVRTNISGAKQDAQAIDDVMGVDGRITIVNGFPKACGEIRYGVSNHTARLVLTAKKFDNSINFVMNLKYLPSLIESIQNNTKLTHFEFNRDSQPKNIESPENSTMQWLISESINRVGKIPDIIWDKGSVGKEPMIRLFGKSSNDIIQKLKILAKVFPE